MLNFKIIAKLRGSLRLTIVPKGFIALVIKIGEPMSSGHGTYMVQVEHL